MVDLWADPVTHALLVSTTFTPSGTQDVNITKIGGTAFSLGQQLAASSLPIVLTAAQLSTLTPLTTIPVTNTGTFAVQATLTSTTITGTVAVTQSTSPWVTSLASTTITSMVPGTGATNSGKAIGNVVGSTDTGVGILAKITDSPGTGTVEGQYGIVRMNTSGFLWSQVIGEVAITEVQDNVTVVGTGTFVVQATLAAETTKVIGTVNQGTSPWVVAATLSAETTKVIGTVNIAASQTIAVTNTGTFATQSAITAASGAIASGAIASGAVVSGAFVSGSLADGAIVTLGAKTDAKSTATDGTSVTIMQVLKEISAMAQAPASTPVTNADMTTLAGVVTSSRAAVNPIVGQSGVQGGSGVVSATTQRVVLATDIALPSGTNLIGNVGNGKTIKTVTGTVSVDTDIVASVAAKRIKVIAYSLISSATTLNTITFQSNASTALWTIPLQAITGTISGANLATSAPSFLFATTAGEKLTLDVSTAQNVTYSLSYFDDDAT